MTKLSYAEVSAKGIWNVGRQNWTVTEVETASTDFYNLKNKAEGARRYGYRAGLESVTLADGTKVFRSDYQTTLNGARYQSSKQGDWFTTEAEAVAAVKKTIAGALKRYAKLAQDPAASKIEQRAS